MFLISAIEIKVKCLVYCYKMYNKLNQLNQLKLWLKKVTLKVFSDPYMVLELFCF